MEGNMRLYQQYIIMSGELYATHFQGRYPDAVELGDYLLAPFINTERLNVEAHCTSNSINFSSPNVADIIEQLESGTASVILTDIDTVLAVKSHFEPIELGEDSAL